MQGCCTCTTTITTTKTILSWSPSRIHLIRNALITWNSLQYSARKIVPVHFAVRTITIIFSPESLNWRLLYHSRLQSCCSRTYCHTKSLFTASQPDSNRLRVKRHVFFSQRRATRLPIMKRNGFHNTANTMLCAEPCHICRWKKYLYTNFLLCKMEKVAVKTNFFICAALWIYWILCV